MNEQQRAEILTEVAERIALWNEFRSDDFQDLVVREVRSAREYWRDGEESELPPRGAAPMFDALVSIADVSDSSPMEVRDACAAAFRAAEEARVAR